MGPCVESQWDMRRTYPDAESALHGIEWHDDLDLGGRGGALVHLLLQALPQLGQQAGASCMQWQIPS